MTQVATSQGSTALMVAVVNRDEYILESVQQAMPMLHNMALRYRLDVEDLRQEGAILAMELYEKACSAENPRAFLHGVIKNAALRHISKQRSELSLDAPLDEESGVTFADLLPAPVDQPQGCLHTWLSTALHQLPREEQCFLQQEYDLEFAPVSHSGRAFKQHRPEEALMLAALGRLRSNKQLEQAYCATYKHTSTCPVVIHSPETPAPAPEVIHEPIINTPEAAPVAHTHKEKKPMSAKKKNLLVLADNLQVVPDTVVGNGNGVFAAGAQGAGKTVVLKLLLEQLAQKSNAPMCVFDKEEDLIATTALFPRGIVATATNCPSAKDIYQGGLQVVFDLSSFPNNDIAGQMMARLTNALMKEAEATAFNLRVPCVVALDEGSYWLPQNFGGKSLDETTFRMLRDAFEAVASRGRKRGIVPLIFTQKFSTVAKEVLSPGTYILMKQVLHTEQSRYLDYILPIEEFKYYNDRQKKIVIGDLQVGEAIVRLANGDQKRVQFYHCESPHIAHTPSAQAAADRYANVTFNPNQRFGAYIEDESMEETPAAVPTTDQLPTLSTQGEKPAKRVRKLPEHSIVEPRVRAAFAENPDITVSVLSRQAKVSFADAKLWIERLKSETSTQSEALVTASGDAQPESANGKRRIKKA